MIELHLHAALRVIVNDRLARDWNATRVRGIAKRVWIRKRCDQIGRIGEPCVGRVRFREIKNRHTRRALLREQAGDRIRLDVPPETLREH